MTDTKTFFSKIGINLSNIYRNLSLADLVEHEIKNEEGKLGANGEIICMSGKFTGRSPKDKFIVKESTTKDHIWWGNINQELSQESFDYLFNQVKKYLSGKDAYIYDGFCGADKKYTMPVRFLTLKAWHSHFVKNMFIEPCQSDLNNFNPEFTIINACDYLETEKFRELGLNSEVFIVFDLGKKLAIIGGTHYAGEMKKGIFSIMNYLLPFKDVMPMHCSANIGKNDNVALFFGLSGTGKTTLSTDSNRRLIGDDEHGWSDDGIFNFEGGCYAKTIKLSQEKEPEIWDAIKFGAILENVVFDETTRKVDFDNDSITENTRVSYPLDHIENIEESGKAGHPKNIIFLTCDAFGVLPPVSRLSPEQASYHFLSGYTAKVAGTERGIKEPQATFSTCFGSPFMTRHPKIYGDLLTKKMAKYNVNAYLVNTGWIGGEYGTGSRIDLPTTRKLITAILNGSINKSNFIKDEVFGFDIPTNLADISADILNPRESWKDKMKYDEAQKKLAKMFIENFKEYENEAEYLVKFGPKI